MSFPKEKAFNPQVSKVPILGSSSGNPDSFQDPNSMASLGQKIQAATDQARADTLYDAQVPSPLSKAAQEGFRNEVYSPWILGTEACKKEGFNMRFPESLLNIKVSRRNPMSGFIGLVILGFLALHLSFRKGR